MLSYTFLYIIVCRSAYGSDLMITSSVHLAKNKEQA